jgi:hypothetical protein
VPQGKFFLPGGNQALEGAALGLGVGVVGSLLVGALLDNHGCRGKRAEPSARFLPGLLPGGGNNCPPPPFPGNYPQPGYGYPQPGYGYPQPGYGGGPLNQYPSQPYNAGYGTNYPRNPGSSYASPQYNNGYNGYSNGYNNNYGSAPSFVPSHNPPYPNSGYSSPNNGYNSPNNGYNSPNNGYNSPNHGYSSPNHGYSSPSNGYVAPSGYAGRSPPSGSLPIIVGLPDGQADSASVSEFAKSAKHFDKSVVNFGN